MKENNFGTQYPVAAAAADINLYNYSLDINIYICIYKKMYFINYSSSSMLNNKNKHNKNVK